MGARPMTRLITDELKKPLAQMILFGELAQGGVVRVRLSDDLDDDLTCDKDDKHSKLIFDVVQSASQPQASEMA